MVGMRHAGAVVEVGRGRVGLGVGCARSEGLWSGDRRKGGRSTAGGRCWEGRVATGRSGRCGERRRRSGVDWTREMSRWLAGGRCEAVLGMRSTGTAGHKLRLVTAGSATSHHRSTNELGCARRRKIRCSRTTWSSGARPRSSRAWPRTWAQFRSYWTLPAQSWI